MKKAPKGSEYTIPNPVSLRKKAEEKFRATAAKTELPPEETQRMLYELRVHQIELEMQNEELRRTQAELETTRARYFDLYDLAPVGYCTLSEQGLILEANLTAATLLGMARGALSKQLLTQFIIKEDQDIFYLNRKQLFETGEPQACELRMVKNDGMVFWALLAATIAHDADGNPVCRIIMSDISERNQMEETLRKSEENFRRSLEDSPLGVRIVTTKGETIYANKALLDIYGYANVEELNKIPLKERYTPQSYSEFHIRKKARDQGDFGPSVYEINIVRKNGEIRHLQVLRKEIFWNGTRQFQVIYQDITERKRAERALQESEERYRLLFHSVNDSVFLHETKPGTTGHFKFLEVNDCACERLGYTRDEMLGLNVADIDVPEQAQNVPEILRKLYTDGQAMFETEHFSKDRVRIPMEVNIRLVKYKGRDVTLSVARDITERKQAESQREAALEVLRETRDYLDNLIGYANAPIITWDIDHRITKFNHAFEKFTGYHAVEVIGQGLSLLFPSGSIGESLQKITRTSTGELWDSVEIPIKRKNGEVRIALWNSANIYAKDGKTIMATIAQGQDITERKRAEESIRASLTEKEILLKEVHHRVKNNLMTIIGLIKMQEMKADNKIFTTLLLELEGRIRAMALVHESLHKSEDLGHIDLKNYIETMSAHIRVQFGAERDIRFSVQVVGVNVGLDIAIPCGLILNEVIANAYKHAFPEDEPRAGEDNCEIKVIVNQEGGMNELIVTDNGVGLPAGTNWENPETLGLRLVRMLNQQLNGSIDLDRTRGTAFRLRFAHSSIAS